MPYKQMDLQTRKDGTPFKNDALISNLKLNNTVK